MCCNVMCCNHVWFQSHNVMQHDMAWCDSSIWYEQVPRSSCVYMRSRALSQRWCTLHTQSDMLLKLAWSHVCVNSRHAWLYKICWTPSDCTTCIQPYTTGVDNSTRRSGYRITKETSVTQTPGEATHFALETDHKLVCHLLPAGMCSWPHVGKVFEQFIGKSWTAWCWCYL